MVLFDLTIISVNVFIPLFFIFMHMNDDVHTYINSPALFQSRIDLLLQYIELEHAM